MAGSRVSLPATLPAVSEGLFGPFWSAKGHPAIQGRSSFISIQIGASSLNCSRSLSVSSHSREVVG